MTMQIGRVTVDLDANGASFDGDRMKVKGYLEADSVNALKTLRDQLRGLTDPASDPVYPVVWDTDPTIDGFYRLQGVNIDASPEAYMTGGWMSYDINLERLPAGNALPGVESILQGGFRPNDVSVANTAHGYSTSASMYLQPWWAVPSSAVELLLPDGVNHLAADAYDTQMSGGYPGGYQTQVIRWAISAADFYDGACLIEQLVDSTWMPVVGRQPIITDTSALRISNGYMGVTFEHPTTPGQMGLRFHGFGRTAGVLDWTPASQFFHISASSSVVSTINAISVLRNDPEEVRVRLSGLRSGVKDSFFTVDVSLRRGAEYVTAVFPANHSISGSYIRLDATANVASTTTAEGIYQTTASGGLQAWAMSNRATTKDTTVGSLLVAASTTNAFGLGPVWDGNRGAATSGWPTDYLGEVLRWFAPFTERQRIVGR